MPAAGIVGPPQYLQLYCWILKVYSAKAIHWICKNDYVIHYLKELRILKWIQWIHWLLVFGESDHHLIDEHCLESWSCSICPIIFSLRRLGNLVLKTATLHYAYTTSYLNCKCAICGARNIGNGQPLYIHFFFFGGFCLFVLSWSWFLKLKTQCTCPGFFGGRWLLLGE